MKILDFIIGVIGMMICTVVFTIACLIVYIPTAMLTIYVGLRRKGKGTVKSELDELNRMFISNIKSYFRSYI